VLHGCRRCRRFVISLSHFRENERHRIGGVEISDIRRDEAWAKANPALYRQLLAHALADPFAGEPGHQDGAARQLAARAEHDTWDRLPAISCPVLVTGGRHDGIAKPEVVTALASRIPGAQLDFFEGGHLFMLEDKNTYPAMVDFLSL
jgi:3-oxoadipate enol-lactonase